VDGIRRTTGIERTIRVHHPAQPYLISALYRELGLPVLAVLATEAEAIAFHEQLPAWLGRESEILMFPKPDTLTFEESPLDPYIEQQRLNVMSALMRVKREHSDRPVPLLVTSAPALARKIAAPEDFEAGSQIIFTGMSASPSLLLSRWTAQGYRRETTVETPGVISVHGGNTDIFPLNGTRPARIEFLGNRVESIRLFDPETQRSTEPVSEVEIAAGGRAATDSLLSYLPGDALLVLVDMKAIEVSLREIDEQTEKALEYADVDGTAPPRVAPHFAFEELATEIDRIPHRLQITRWSTDGPETGALPFASAPSYPGQQRQMLLGIRSLVDRGSRTVIVSRQAARLSEILQEEGLPVSPVSGIDCLPPAGSLTLVCCSPTPRYSASSSRRGESGPAPGRTEASCYTFRQAITRYTWTTASPVSRA